KLTDLANEINGKSHANDLAALQELVEKAQQAKVALNGIEKNSEIAQAIDKLNNLSTEQKTQLKTLVEAQNSLADAQTIKQNATDLNTELTELKAKLTDANEVKNQPIYLLESQNEQDALNNAITQADQLLSNVQNTQFNQNNLTNLATLAQDTQAKTESLNNAIQQLNGVHKDLIAKIDEFELLTAEQKAELKEAVKTFDKNLTKEQVLSHLENYLEKSKSNAQTQVAQLSNLSDSEKAAYKQKLKNAALKYKNSTNPDWVIQAQDENNAKLKFDHDVTAILKQAQADNAAKQALINHINNDLANLTQNQKATLVNKVKATDVSQAADLTKYADDLDKAMLDYKNENFGDIKNEIDYTQASSEKQKAFDVQLKNQKNNTNVQNGADFDLVTVKAEHAKLIASR
ncbi:GA module-containing protein, partial [Mycoplasmopsis pullorum]|uniref:GA module-containing protein n=1 Tax=Mycoplasmopsis pullorum TaxID=48003 RepID=UPI0015D61109